MTDRVGPRPAVFLDRDGTIIREAEYLADPEGVELIDGVPQALRALRRAGYALVIVTNQSGIARGLYSEEDYHAVAARLHELLDQEDAAPDHTEYCPHHPDFPPADHSGRGTAGSSAPERDEVDSSPLCDCRKPAAEMHRRAIEALDLDPSRSWFVGDKVSDLIPAVTLGGTPLLVRTGYGTITETEEVLPGNTVVSDDLPAAAGYILSVDPVLGHG